MAINNGNHDYNLVAIQTSANAKRIKIVFKVNEDIFPADPLNLLVDYPNRVYVSPPLQKSYSSLKKGDIITEYVDVKNFGEFRVKLSSGRGYMYDWVDVMVKITGTISTSKYTFTKTDCLVDAAGNFVVALTLTGITGGFAASASLVGTITSGVGCAVLGAYGVYLENTDKSISSILPKEGWSIIHEFTQSGDYITHKLRIWDSNNRELPSELYTLRLNVY